GGATGERTALGERAERRRVRELHRRAAQTGARGSDHAAAVPGGSAGARDRSTDDGVPLDRAIVLNAHLQTMIAAKLRRDFSEPQVAAILRGHWRVVEGLIRLHAAIRSEEPHLVAPNRSAERRRRLHV